MLELGENGLTAAALLSARMAAMAIIDFIFANLSGFCPERRVTFHLLRALYIYFGDPLKRVINLETHSLSLVLSTSQSFLG